VKKGAVVCGICLGPCLASAKPRDSEKMGKKGREKGEKWILYHLVLPNGVGPRGSRGDSKDL